MDLPMRAGAELYVCITDFLQHLGIDSHPLAAVVAFRLPTGTKFRSRTIWKPPISGPHHA